MNKNTKIYIAGHKGMVGSSITRRLAKDGYANLITRDLEQLDLLDQAKVRTFFETEKPEYVILAAARVGGIKANMTYPSEFLYENLMIQNNVIWAAHHVGVEKLMLLGTSCVYPRDCPQPMKEEYLMTGPLEPTNEGYALAKIAGIKLCQSIFDQFNQTFISCMPTNIYGENDYYDPIKAHALPALLSRIHQAKMDNAKEVVVWGTGNARREWLYVDDLADAVYWMMQNYEQKEFVNVGTGVDHSITELAEMIAKTVGYKGKLTFDTTKPDGMPQKLLNVSKMTKLGWKAKMDLASGLKKTYKLYLENNHA